MQQGQLAIQAAASSLKGLRERYQAGKSNLTDVLNEQEQLVNAQIQYDSYRYDYIIELLNLKKATGILAVNDLQKINDWLV